MNLEQIKSALEAGNFEPIQKLIDANANVLPHGLYRIKNEDIQFMNRNDIFDLDELLDVLELPIDQIYWLTQNKFWILMSGETTSGFYVFHSEIEPLANLTIRNGGDFAEKGEFDIPNTLGTQDGEEVDFDPDDREATIELLIANGYTTKRELSDEDYQELCVKFESDLDGEEDYNPLELSDEEAREKDIDLLISKGYTKTRDLTDAQIEELFSEMEDAEDLDNEEDDGSVLAFDLGDGTFIVGAID